MKLIKTTLKTEKNFKNSDAEKLRGFFGNYFREDILFHNHKTEFEFNYDYSFIQYKVVNGKLTLLGIDKGADIILNKVQDIKKVRIGEEEIEVSLDINITFPELFIDENKRYKYKFETIWLALNDKNYLKYREGKLDLNRQLANNILEFFKMCGIWVDKKIEVDGNFQEIHLKQKDINMLGFVGEFITNVSIPDDISLGKRKSIGMGRIKKIGEVDKNDSRDE